MSLPNKICPRCGRRISYLKKRRIRGRTYVYAVHYLGSKDGKKITEECYLGPLESYEYVSKLHEREGLVLKGLIDNERVLDYLRSILDYLVYQDLPKYVLKEAIEMIEECLRELKRKLEFEEKLSGRDKFIPTKEKTILTYVLNSSQRKKY